MKPGEYIDGINKDCKLIVNKDFQLTLRGGNHNLQHYAIEGRSMAINRFDTNESVSVLSWFDEFWLYMEMKFAAHPRKIRNKIIPDTSINVSLSVFQGQDHDPEKYQLFRAEWDDYNDTEQKHAQPHWHITSDQAIERSFSKYSDTFEKQDFIELLQSEKQNVFDVKKIHFAMNGDWQNNKVCVHKINESEQIRNWLRGLLTHLRTELTQ